MRGQRLTPERLKKLKIGEDITDVEKEILLKVLFNREARIAFDFSEKGYFKPEIEPLQVIPTIVRAP